MPGPSQLSRRDWLRLTAVGAVGVSQSGWLRALADDATDNPTRRKSIILLWLNGGPATIDLWDLKPGHANGGPYQEIDTAVPGVKISEHLPKLAKRMDEIAIIRSMATREGDHRRARIVSLTGYAPVGAIQFPSVGSLIAHEFDDPATDLPGFVSVGGRNGADLGAGFLGPRFSPLVVGGGERRLIPGRGADELKVPDLDRPEGLSAAAYAKRLELLHGLENGFDAGKKGPVAETLKAATDRAVRLMRPEAAAAFRLEAETAEVRAAYGRTTFGQGCLLARRLVERGVPFVEVTLDGWDTHQNNFDRVAELSGTLDTAFAALLADLEGRGLLDSTLVVCQGEFGRTPRINGQAGRDHWPASWSAVLAGGGIHAGQVIGKTSADGIALESKPTRTPDLIATVVKAIGIDPMKQNMSNVGRPIRIADPTAKPIEELL
ncbi:Uncharacterized conserved protein, DUF1501 family [Singulisphaera sp. GP187]|uniref:DUF1501 domain-containing protein n=1 Tax=Singulisphaera sp. GP187 TaxID=1882752 RepID=UPI00092C062C|nr:DUF1501 domain-containing protein [Singulisphaera sp. GP187]SIO60604.1 Uncharacterized conserved protein, DUF1501 family [Singulisphaera sp. GP187]